ncbi:MAG: phosphotransferase [Pelagibacteraceae bacterium]|nr:phosphotransferase [Pelagibacteraceae bacterium]MBT3902458.1 phosphotransferase [Pelagibacteraceae bacterium]MBT4645272.1 phosphotransferase [Pelagibacteraceae bacterium]
MISEKYIKQIEDLLNNEKIIKHDLLQISFNIACLKFEISNNKKYIVKFFIERNNKFNAIKSEINNLTYLNKKFKFFPKVVKSNDNFLIMEYLENDNDKPDSTNIDFLESIVKIHSVSNRQYGFGFNTQIGAIKQINNFENNWVYFYSNYRLNDILEIANKRINLGKVINKKILLILNNMKNLIPSNPKPLLLHGDLWEGNILFKKNKFVGFIDPGSFFGHSEMEVAYLRWFNPPFVDINFLDKYNDKILLDKDYLNYEPIYQLYYALCNVALWDSSYIKEVKKLLDKIKL